LILLYFHLFYLLELVFLKFIFGLTYIEGVFFLALKFAFVVVISSAVGASAVVAVVVRCPRTSYDF